MNTSTPSRRRARSDSANSQCSICNESHYTNHFSQLVEHIRPSSHSSPRLSTQRSGIEDIIPDAGSRRLFEAIYPFTCAAHSTLFSEAPAHEHRSHWTHLGCIATVFLFSALDQPLPGFDHLQSFFQPSARRFEQFRCPTCNSSLRPSIITHGATRSFSVGRTFPFGRRYPTDSLCPQQEDLPLEAIPTCVICQWPHLTEAAFRARAFTLLNPRSLGTSREALLRVTFDDQFFERCNRHLIQDFRNFAADQAISQTGMGDVVLDLTPLTVPMFGNRFSGCPHPTHLGCLGLYLVASCLRMESGGISIHDITCPHPDCRNRLSPSLFRNIEALSRPSRFPFQGALSLMDTEDNDQLSTSTDLPHRATCYICQFQDLDFDSFVDVTFSAVRPAESSPRPSDYSIWHAMAEAGFHFFFPGANPTNVNGYFSIFECNHQAHLGCLLNNVYSYSLRDDIWGIRSPSSYRCGACSSPLRRDFRAYSEFWGSRSAFPGLGHRSLNNLEAHIYPRPLNVPTLLAMHFRPMPYNVPQFNPDPSTILPISRLFPPPQPITEA